MNIQEGLRRLGILLGVLGFAAGLYFSLFIGLPELKQTREAHKSFQQVMQMPILRRMSAVVAGNTSSCNYTVPVERDGVKKIACKNGQIDWIRLDSGESYMDFRPP